MFGVTKETFVDNVFRKHLISECQRNKETCIANKFLFLKIISAQKYKILKFYLAKNHKILKIWIKLLVSFA